MRRRSGTRAEHGGAAVNPSAKQAGFYGCYIQLSWVLSRVLENEISN